MLSSSLLDKAGFAYGVIATVVCSVWYGLEVAGYEMVLVPLEVGAGLFSIHFNFVASLTK